MEVQTLTGRSHQYRRSNSENVSYRKQVFFDLQRSLLIQYERSVGKDDWYRKTDFKLNAFEGIKEKPYS